MSFSNGTRTLYGEIAGWIVCVGMLTVSAVHFDEIRSFTQLILSPPSEQAALAAAEQAEPELEQSTDGTVELRVNANGHYHAEAEINGRPVEVLVDTGATMVALTYEDAMTAGIHLKRSDFTHAVSTANGMARVAPVTLERVTIGDITVRNVKAAVAEAGKLQMTLLGMTFLGKLEHVGIRSGVLLLQE